MSMQNAAHEVVTFEERLNGSFYGVLRWEQLDELWQVVENAGEAWYIYTVSEAPPELPLEASEVMQFINELTAELRVAHDESYCGLVYVDDKENPTLIKIYDPAKFRGSCSCGPAALPGWIFSKQKPVDLLAVEKPESKAKSHWWNRLFGTREVV